jgi:hypothetical protein
MSRSMQLLLGMVLFGAGGITFAAGEPREDTRMEAGEVFEIDLGRKTAIIGGYIYGFSGTGSYDLPTIKMLGSGFGAFEMLQVGMKVKVTYIPTDSIRLVVELSQLASNTEIGDGGFAFPSEGDDP